MTLSARSFSKLGFAVLMIVGLFATNLSAQQTENGGQEDPLLRSRPKQEKAARQENAYKKWLDEVSPIITPEELGAFRRLTNDAERDSYIEIFWQRRDPTPDTTENEYKEEFYRRRAYADERFSAGKPGSKTDRGLVYIIHGPPDSIDAHPAGGPYLRPAQEGGGQTQTYPFETWRYRNLDGIGQEVEIEFVDSCGCGDYHVTLDPSEKDAFLHVPGAGLTDLEMMQRSSKADRLRGGVANPGTSLFAGNRQGQEFDRIRQMALVTAAPPIGLGSRENVTSTVRFNLLPLAAEVDYIKGAQDAVMVPITLSIPNSALTFVLKEGVQHAAVSLSGQVSTMTGKRVQTFEDGLRLDIPDNLITTRSSGRSLYSKTLALRPGRYRLDVEAKDVNGTRVGWLTQALEIPDFSSDALMSSSLILADQVEPIAANEIGAAPFVIGRRRVRPRVASGGGVAAFRSGESVVVWSEVYNLSAGKQPSPGATAEYRLQRQETGAPALLSTQQLTVRDQQAVAEKRFPPGELPTGDYLLTVTVRDGASGQSIVKTARFTVR